MLFFLVWAFEAFTKEIGKNPVYFINVRLLDVKTNDPAFKNLQPLNPVDSCLIVLSIICFIRADVTLHTRNTITLKF